MPMSLRHLLSVSLLAVVLVQVPGTNPAHARALQSDPVRRDRIPFESAQVGGQGDRIVLSWSAPGVRTVKVHAGGNAGGTHRGRLVGMSTGTGAVTLELSPSTQAERRYFTLVPDRGRPLVVADRGIGLATAPNLRDLGGLRTADGHWVRLGLLYRSDQMNLLGDADLARLSGLGIGLVADLRTQPERNKEPDRVPPGARHAVFDVMADRGGMDDAMREAAEGRGEALMTRAYADFVSAPAALGAYRGLLGELGQSQGPVLYHCTAGKDRTGWASVVILMALGVPKEDAVNDFLASNQYLVAKNEKYYAALPHIPRERLEVLLTVRRSFIDASFAEVERRYGGFDAYVRDGLGLDESTIRALKSRYLTP